MKIEHKRAVLNRLKTSRGHLDAVIRMVEDDTYCPDVMKQMSAVQGSLERASRVVLRNHLETCVAAAMAAGRTEAIVDELMEALRFDRIATGPSPADDGPGAGPDPAGAQAATQEATTTTTPRTAGKTRQRA